MQGKTLYDRCRQTGKQALLDQWHPDRNSGLTPGQVTAGSHKKVWWRCKMGHEWQAEVRSRYLGTGCPYCAGKKAVPGESDLVTRKPELAAQWNPTKNGAITPDQVTPGSHKKVWWVCPKGHQWQALVMARSAGEGCPVCAGKAVIPGEGDLATLFPKLASQWDWEKNGALTPDTLSPYSNRKVWWNCEKGHSYQAAVAARTHRGRGCPYCAGKRVLAGFNDLATRYPQIAAQWHPDLNQGLTPDRVTAGSRREVWWRCPEGHVWKARIHSRTGKQKCGCPVCAGRGRAAARSVPPAGSYRKAQFFAKGGDK